MTPSNTYREWRVVQNLPQIRFLLVFSAIAWAVVPSFNASFYPGDLPKIVYWVCLTIHLPLCLAGLALTASPWCRYANLYISALILLTGFNNLWGAAEVWNSPGGVTVIGVWYALLCPFVRLPLRNVLSVTFPIIALTAAWLLLYFDLSLVQAFTELGFLGLSLCLAIPFALMNERLLKQSFIQQQTIAKQHEELEARQQETEASRNLIRRYVPAAVADNIISGNESDVADPQRRRITVLFSDIVGFNDLADRLDAESLTQIINEYMAAMAEIVEQHGGTLNEFAGDGLMALFGAPADMSPEEQAVNSLQAAQEMQARLPSLNDQWLKLGIGEAMQIRVGINTGVLSVGSFGSAGRMTYTAIGLQTNIAARIQSHCEPGGILLSDASWQLVKDQIDCEPRGEVECKGVHFPVKVYAPMVSP